MATRTADDRNEEGKRDAAALEELRSALVESVAGEARKMATRLMNSSEATAARVDGLLREAVLEAGRRGPELAMQEDRSDCDAANAPAGGDDAASGLVGGACNEPRASGSSSASPTSID